MKYLLFAGQCYYAEGGINDLLSQSNSIEDLILTINSTTTIGADVFTRRPIEWWHIYDMEKRKPIIYSVCQPFGSADYEDLKEDKSLFFYEFNYDTKTWNIAIFPKLRNEFDPQTGRLITRVDGVPYI